MRLQCFKHKPSRIKGSVLFRNLRSGEKRVIDNVIREANHFNINPERNDSGTIVALGKTVFDLPNRKIEGPTSGETDRVKDLLRRHGVRFRFYDDGEEYRPWD